MQAVTGMERRTGNIYANAAWNIEASSSVVNGCKDAVPQPWQPLQATRKADISTVLHEDIFTLLLFVHRKEIMVSG